MTRSCRHEPAVLATARASQNVVVPDAIQAHLAECEDCRLGFALAVTLQGERSEAMAAVRLPSAGQVWWRAELRARQDAAATVARPITVVTGVAAAAVVGVVASLLGALVWWARAWVMATVARVPWPATPSPDVWSTGTWLAVGLALGTLLLATPLVLYVASREE